MLTMLALTALAAPPADGPTDAAITAVRALAWDRAAAEAVAAGLEHPDVAVKRETVRLLGQLGADVDRWIVPLVSSAEPELARTAAEALALAPGGPEPLVAAWGAGRDDAVGVAILDGLGRRGDGSSVDLLVRALGRPEAPAIEAAHALGRLGRRKVEGIAAALPGLVRCVEARPPAVATACGWALYRIGLEGADASLLRRIRARAPKLAPVGRAWAVRALGTVESPPAWALADAEVVVRVAGLASPHVPVATLLAHLDDPAPWVADQALLSAAGRPAAEIEAPLRARYDATDEVWARAALAGALSAAGVAPTREDLADHARVAGAWMETAPPSSWVLLGEGPPTRVAGIAGALMGRVEEVAADPSADAILHRLMTGSEPVGWAAAAVLAAELGDVDALVRLLGRADGDTVQSALQAISEADLAEAARPRLAAAIAPHLHHPQPRLRIDAAVALAHLEVDAPEAAAPTWGATPDFAPPEAAERVIVTTNRGDITIALRPELAPRAVQAFVHLARAGAYDGVVWHRVVPAFVVQTGDPTGTGWGGPGFALPDEDSLADYVVGAVGFAKSGPDTAGSQWFITTVGQPHLTGHYTLFGDVVAGMDVALSMRQGDRIESVAVVDR